MNGFPRRTRILVLSQVYEPEPSFITADVARALARGARVTVVAAHPNYPRGRFYPGTKWWTVKKSVEDSVEVWRVPVWPNHSLSPIQRGLCYMSYVVSASLVAPFVAGRPEVVWVYHGPFTTGIVSLFFKAFRGSKVAFTCADLWPESFAAAGVIRSASVMRALFAYRRWLNRTTDTIICATRGTAERFRAEGYSAERLPVVPVWIPGVEALTALPAESGDGLRHVVYAGNLGPGQRLDTVIRAAAALQETHPDVVVDIYGSGSAAEALEEVARAAGATNVRFHGRVSSETAFSRSRSATAQIVTLQRSPFFHMTVPSKLGFAFAAGAPILHSLEGEAASIAREAGGCFEFDSSDPRSFVLALRQVLELPAGEVQSLRERLRSYFAANFAPSALLARYEEIFASLARPRNAAAR